MKKNVRNLVIAVAMALVAIIAIVSIISIVLKTPEDRAAGMDGGVNVTTNWPEVPSKQVSMDILVEEEEEPKLILVDQSGSMKDLANFAIDTSDNSSYITFSDWLGKTGGNSHIAKNLVLALDMGAKDIVLVSDLESYPESDLDSFDGKFYSGRRIYVFVPNDVDQKYLNEYRERLTDCLDEETCTLVFKAQSTEEVVFDNYVEPGDHFIHQTVDVDPEKVIPEIVVNDTHEFHEGNFIAPSVVRNIWIAFISIVAFLVEVILALLLFGRNNHPEWVKKVVDTKNVALDGSGSVAAYYQSMLKWLKPYEKQIKSLWYFASDVKKLSFAEAKNMTTGGQTYGWSCLAQMQKAGIEELTLVSDLKFNDGEIGGLHFRKIIFIVPSDYDATMLKKLKSFAEECEVITL